MTQKVFSNTELFGRTINRIAAEIWDLYHDQATAEFFRSLWNGYDERIVIDALRLYWRDVDHKNPPSPKQIMKIVYQLKLEGYPDVRKDVISDQELARREKYKAELASRGVEI